MSEVYYTDQDGNPYRRPRWWIGYVCGAVLIVLGILLPCVGTGVAVATLAPQHSPKIKGAGQLTVGVKEPGLMVIWIEEKDDDLGGSSPVVPKDVSATVVGPDGKTIPARFPSEPLTDSTFDSERSGALVFDAPLAGNYDVTVKGTFAPTQSVTVGTDRTSQAAAAGLSFLGAILLGILLFVGGLITLIVTGVRHARYQG